MFLKFQGLQKKIIADLDASRRDLVRSIFKNLVATLQAEILAIKQLWGSPKYVSKNRYSRQLGTLLYHQSQTRARASKKLKVVINDTKLYTKYNYITTTYHLLFEAQERCSRKQIFVTILRPCVILILSEKFLTSYSYSVCCLHRRRHEI